MSAAPLEDRLSLSALNYLGSFDADSQPFGGTYPNSAIMGDSGGGEPNGGAADGRGGSGGGAGGADGEDIYTQLAQKEHDLMLAAELGKALLEQNNELSRKNDQMIDEYNAKLEVRGLMVIMLITVITGTACALFYSLAHVSVNMEKFDY